MSKVTSFPVVKIKPKGIGALPVGLKGKLYGQPFKVLIQYDAFGGVRTQVVEDKPGGSMIFELSGRKGEVDTESSGFGTWAYLGHKKENRDSYPFNNDQDYAKKDKDKIEADIRRRAKEFVRNLHNETKDFNAGKDTKTKKAAPVTIAPKKAPAAKKPAAAAKPTTKTVPVKAYCVKSHKRTIKVPAKK